ncbi:ATP-binding protein [Nonomuraea sp. NPDC050202]|jgi:anti-sigma regulatory factor (Ser/Thr protein kinase)|uniref:ATP-binding protein n=1 Tax=Nonomuraea sp. NPDC050202 TaxID=3155035 RepID=UPI00340146AA
MTGFLNGDRQSLLACRFTHTDLPRLRHMVAWQAARAGLAGMRWDDFVLAVHEGSVNAVGHGGGTGRLRLWRNEAALCCQISDDGPGALAGRLDGTAVPEPDSTGGRGMWLIRQLADEITFASGAEGTLLWIAFRLPG